MAESVSLGGLVALDLPRLYLHPAHAEQVELKPFSEQDLQKEFAIFAEQGIPEQHPGVNFEALPSVDLGDGKISASCAGGSCELLLLFREISLGSDPRTGLPMIALAGCTTGSVWLVVVRSGQSGAYNMLTVLGSMGGIRRDFSDLYTFNPEPLGKGSNAAVYGIFEKRHPGGVSKRIVGKVMLKDYSDSGGAVPKDVSQEVTMLTAVQGHPSIVNFYGLFNCWGMSCALQQPPHWVLLLERCDGRDLFDNVIKKPFSEARARDVMAGLFSALAHVHSRLIVHRDVKPENVLLQGDGTAKLADFGIACHLRDMDEMDRRCGSPGYAAPEILGGRPYGSKVDCFSSGSLLFFLLCTKIPFDGPTIASTLRRSERCIVDFKVSPHFERVSNSCKDLLLMNLRQCPTQRMSAKDSLQHAWFSEDLDADVPLHDRATEPPRLWLTDPEPGDGRASSSSNRGGPPVPPLPPGRGGSKGRSGALQRILRLSGGSEREAQPAAPTPPTTAKRSERIFSNLPQLVTAAFRTGNSFSSFSSNGRASLDGRDSMEIPTDARNTDNTATMHRAAELQATADDQRAFESEKNSVRGYISRGIGAAGAGLKSFVRSKPSLPDNYRTEDGQESERASFDRLSFAKSDGTTTPSTSASGVSAKSSVKGASWASGSSSSSPKVHIPLAPPKAPPRRFVFAPTTGSSSSADPGASAASSSSAASALPAASSSSPSSSPEGCELSPTNSAALGTVFEHHAEADDDTYDIDIAAFASAQNKGSPIGIDVERQAMAAQAEENRMLLAPLVPQPPPPREPQPPPPREPGGATARGRPAGNVRPSSARSG